MKVTWEWAKAFYFACVEELEDKPHVAFWLIVGLLVVAVVF